MFKIVKSIGYADRVLYVVENEDNEVLMVYKSAGLGSSETTKGNIVPFMYLKVKDDMDGDWGMPLGWIRKYFIEDGKEVPYFSKESKDFPKPLDKILEDLSVQLADVPAEIPDTYDEVASRGDAIESIEYIRQINKELKEAVEGKEFVRIETHA